MTLKELVLNSLENLQEFVIDGKQMTKELYEENADKEVASWYVDLSNSAPNKYHIEVKLED